MTKTDNLPLYLCLYKLVQYFYLLIHNFPKEYKYTLGQSILDLGWETLDLVILANNLPNCDKVEKICQVSVSFDQLKTRLRMAHELKLFSLKKYSYIIEQNEEIGKMIAGWLRWSLSLRVRRSNLCCHSHENGNPDS